jgi:ubiquinone/menaquinone biosynthesis C-methylase UbiE
MLRPEKNIMFTTGQDLLHEVGRDHWWQTGRYEIIQRFFQDYGAAGQRLLDVGCGPGNLMEQLAAIANGPLVGIDLARGGLYYAKESGFQHLILADMLRAPLKTASFDFIFAVDICEHLEDDRGLLQEIYRVLKPKGRALLVVPAHPVLWGEHDEQAGHYRRYYYKDFRRLLKQTGFAILRLSYMQSFFFLPLLIFRQLKNLSHSHTHDLFPVPKGLNRLLHRILAAEYYLLSRYNLPIGTNLLGIVEKIC